MATLLPTLLAGLLVIAVVLTGCTATAPCPVLAPLGDYKTEVGEPWSLPLITLDSGAGALRWTLLEGPKDLSLDTDETPPHLVWLATALDLGLTQPGRPRAPGRIQVIRVRACDLASCCVERAGSIQAVPTPTP